MASVLVNGSKKNYERLLVDEAITNHFGAIVMAIKLVGATDVLLIGDINQRSVGIGQELLCTYRNPVDVAYALSKVYSGMYSAAPRLRSLQLKGLTDSTIPKTLEKTLYLVHTQAEKESLKSEGFGSGDGSRILTVHEAQGLTYETVVIVRTSSQHLQLHNSVPHAVLEISRHTISCTYYGDSSNDAIALFIQRAMNATDERLEDYNISMAIRNRDPQTKDHARQLKALAASLKDKN